MKNLVAFVSVFLLVSACKSGGGPPEYATAAALGSEPTQALWGDTHLHSSYSPDAYLFGNTTADPDTAYRYAKGLPVTHPYHGSKIQIGTPLDFLVLSDHAEMMGVPRRLFSGDEELAKTPTGKRFLKLAKAGKNQQIFIEFIGAINSNQPYEGMNGEALRRSVWGEITAATDRHNVPGRFSSFIGWEWTSTPKGKNLHRVVFMPEASDIANEFIPYSSFDSDVPEDLWDWLEATSARTGASFTAIPHNSNISGGLMFDEVDSKGRPITADYARTRMKWEPVVEVTQIKGDSETDPILSPNDELAAFEPFKHVIDSEELGQGADSYRAKPGDFVRSALRRGLELEQKIGVNPYKVGMIGSTDAHTAMSSAEEDNFHGKTAFDSTPKNTFATYLGVKGFGADMSASGMAAVWAETNDRRAIFEAFQRKEVYATTGPRIRLRFFGGWGYSDKAAGAKDLAQQGYAGGVPMGGDLTKAPEGKPPRFLIYAIKDPVGANLDRIQVVKGWLDANGTSQEKVYDVAWSDDRLRDDGTLRPVGNTVDLTTGRYTNDIGTPDLSAVWQDPDFDPAARAFYYVRVIQIPTPRHTLYDAIALGMDPEKTGHPPTIQERAYSSPIWYTP